MVQLGAVPGPGGDAATQEALYHPSVKSGENGGREVGTPWPSQEVETLLGFLHTGLSSSPPHCFCFKPGVEHIQRIRLGGVTVTGRCCCPVASDVLDALPQLSCVSAVSGVAVDAVNAHV